MTRTRCASPVFRAWRSDCWECAWPWCWPALTLSPSGTSSISSWDCLPAEWEVCSSWGSRHRGSVLGVLSPASSPASYSWYFATCTAGFHPHFTASSAWSPASSSPGPPASSTERGGRLAAFSQDRSPGTHSSQCPAVSPRAGTRLMRRRQGMTSLHRFDG